jgi:hypothetical protein
MTFHFDIFPNDYYELKKKMTINDILNQYEKYVSYSLLFIISVF